MTDADKKKVFTAIAVITSIEGQLGNLQKRGPGAAKAWALDLGRATDSGVKQRLKGIIVAITKLVKDAKTVQKDMSTLYKQGSDAKLLAKIATGKEFRDKTAAKLLASCKSFDMAAAQFQLAFANVIGGGLYPSSNEVEVIATVESLKNFSKYYNAIRIELAKL